MVGEFDRHALRFRCSKFSLNFLDCDAWVMRMCHLTFVYQVLSVAGNKLRELPSGRLLTFFSSLHHFLAGISLHKMSHSV